MDNRKEKTRNKIKETYLQLIRKKDPANITAIELCENAGINRSTFYDHFSYMDGLAKEIIKDQIEMVCELKEVDKTSPKDNTGRVKKEIIYFFVKHLMENDVMQIFYKSKRSNNYLNILLDEQTKRTLIPLQQSKENYYRVYFINVALTFTVFEWISHGKTIPMEELIEIIYDYSAATYTH